MQSVRGPSVRGGPRARRQAALWLALLASIWPVACAAPLPDALAKAVVTAIVKAAAVNGATATTGRSVPYPRPAVIIIPNAHIGALLAPHERPRFYAAQCRALGAAGCATRTADLLRRTRQGASPACVVASPSVAATFAALPAEPAPWEAFYKAAFECLSRRAGSDDSDEALPAMPACHAAAYRRLLSAGPAAAAAKGQQAADDKEVAWHLLPLCSDLCGPKMPKLIADVFLSPEPCAGIPCSKLMPPEWRMCALPAAPKQATKTGGKPATTPHHN